MSEVVTEDFETGFVGGFVWKGLDGLRDFLSQRDGFFDETHTIEELLDRGGAENGDLQAKTRLRFFLRRWEAPSPVSEEFTGLCFHAWRVREVDGGGASLHRWSSASRPSTTTPCASSRPLTKASTPSREPHRAGVQVSADRAAARASATSSSRPETIRRPVAPSTAA